MLKRVGWEFQCLKEKGWNSKVQNDKAGSTIVKRIRLEFQCLKGKGRKSKVYKDNVGSPKF